MICGARSRALLIALPLVLPLAGCMQILGYPPAGQPMAAADAGAGPGQSNLGAGAGVTSMDGTWSSNDGVFVATFERGNFTSRFTQTNEVLAQGTYRVSGSTVTLEWVSIATQQRRSATCAIATPDSVTCNQSGGGSFDLNRSV